MTVIPLRTGSTRPGPIERRAILKRARWWCTHGKTVRTKKDKHRAGNEVLAQLKRLLGAQS